MGPIFLGIDGGGTRTRAVVAGSDLLPLGRGASGPANAATRPLPRIVETIHEAAQDALAAAGAGERVPEAVGVGLAGIDSIHDRRPLLLALEGLFGAGRVFLTSDARAALAGASREPLGSPAVVLIAGTGAIAFGQARNGRTDRAGGYGPVLGDEGSGYAIARNGLRAVVREIDGRGPRTTIKDRLFATEDIRSITDLLERVYRSEGGAADVAAYFPLVLAAASKDADPEALRILAEAAGELALDTVTVIRNLGLETETFPVATIGGVFTAGAPLLDPLRAAIAAVAPGATVGPPAFPPEIGAIRLALSEERG